MFRCLLLIFLLMGEAAASGRSLIELPRRTNSSLLRRVQEMLAKGLEISLVPLFSVIDAAAGLNWQQRLQAKHLLTQRHGIYASQVHRYRQHQDSLTARHYHDLLLHYRIDELSHIGTPSSHVQPENKRLLRISGEEIKIADLSGVLVWNHSNYGKRVEVALQDAQFLQAHGQVTMPADISRLYGEINGVFNDDFHLIRVSQVKSQGSEELSELQHDCTFIAPRHTITSLDNKDGELRSLL